MSEMPNCPKVLDQCYHEKCLRCSQCSDPFRSGTCFFRNGALFCRDDFAIAFGPKCSRCGAPIRERSIVRRANQHIYHLECFQCAVCKVGGGGRGIGSRDGIGGMGLEGWDRGMGSKGWDRGMRSRDGIGRMGSRDGIKE